MIDIINQLFGMDEKMKQKINNDSYGIAFLNLSGYFI